MLKNVAFVIAVVSVLVSAAATMTGHYDLAIRTAFAFVCVGFVAAKL